MAPHLTNNLHLIYTGLRGQGLTSNPSQSHLRGGQCGRWPWSCKQHRGLGDRGSQILLLLPPPPPPLSLHWWCAALPFGGSSVAHTLSNGDLQVFTVPRGSRCQGVRPFVRGPRPMHCVWSCARFPSLLPVPVARGGRKALTATCNS